MEVCRVCIASALGSGVAPCVTRCIRRYQQTHAGPLRGPTGTLDTLPWGGIVPLQSVRHLHARPITRRSAGWCARRFKPAVLNPINTLNGGRLWRSAGWSARSTYRLCIPSLVVFERSTQTSPAFGRRRLRHRREDVRAGLHADVGDKDGGGRGAALRHPDHSRSALPTGPIQRGTATDPLGPSLRSGPDRGLLSPMLDRAPHAEAGRSCSDVAATGLRALAAAFSAMMRMTYGKPTCTVFSVGASCEDKPNKMTAARST